MSDISIPGVSSKYNTDKMIDSIMEAERVPLHRMEDRKEDFAQEKKVWNEVDRKLSTLQTNARNLYSYESPFKEYIANSSDTSILSATASRNASKGVQELKVQQVAAADSFRSQALGEDFQVPEGTYSFSVGEQNIEFQYKGGELDDFVKRLNRRGRGIVEAQLVKNTPSSNILVLRSMQTGAENQLTFQKDARSLGIEAGILKRVATGERDIALAADTVQTGTRSDLQGDVQVQAETLELQARSSAAIQISPSVPNTGKLQIELTVQIENLSEEEYVPPTPPSGPQLPSSGGVELEGVQVQNAPNEVELPPWEPPPKPERVDNLQVLYANGDQALPALQDTEEVQTVSFAASDLKSALNSIQVNNDNTHRRITVSAVRVLNPEARGDFEPQFPVSTAQDAILTINGIPVERSSNDIDDVIPGVSLQPRRASDRSVELEIAPDKEAIKNGLIQFLGSYNQAITEINILTSNQESVIEEISYYEDADREKAREKLGTFMGDTTFMQMKNRLQRIVTSPYETSAGRELSMLQQMGISTNATSSGTVSRSKLRGYLEVDESDLDEAIDTNLQAVAELFGRDTDGDLVIDTGLAVEMHDFLNSYTRTGGLIDTRTAGLDRQISDTESEIVDFKARLEDKEVDLKRQYGRMESSLGQLEESQRSIENFNQRNSQ